MARGTAWAVAAWVLLASVPFGLGGLAEAASPPPDPLQAAAMALRAAGAPEHALAKVEAAAARAAALGAAPGMATAPRAPGPSEDASVGLVESVFGDGCDSGALHPALDGARVPSGPIEIRSDLDLTPLNGVIGGTGTAQDPFLIALRDIRPPPSAPGGPLLPFEAALLIEGTTAHVRVEHVSIRPALALAEAARALGEAVSPAAGEALGSTVDRVGAVLSRGGMHHVGVLVRDARNVVLQGVQVSGAEIGVAFQGHVEATLRCSALTANEWSGVGDDFEPVTSGRVVVERNLISGNAWGGVDVWEDGAASWEFRGNVFEGNAWAGLNLWGDVLGGASLAFEGNAARGNAWGGLEVWGDYLGDSVVRVEGNVLSGNAWAGLDVWGDFRARGDVAIADNVAEGNAWAGLNAWGDQRGGGTLRVEGNRAHDNRWGGVELWGDHAGTAVQVRGNAADRNAWSGLDLWGDLAGGSLEASGNAAAGNGWAGMAFWGGLSAGASAVLEGNTLRGNGFKSNYGGLETWGATPAGTSLRIVGNALEDNRYGLRLGRGSPQVEGNDILGNDIGIYLQLGRGAMATPTAHGNNIAGNALWGYRNEFSLAVDARDNWWGDVSGPGGAGPGAGDKVTAFVDFDPWRTAPA